MRNVTRVGDEVKGRTKCHYGAEMRGLPGGTVTLLSSDLEGSTKLLRSLGPEKYARLLARHREIMRGAFSAHGGAEVDTQGDAFFATFARARDAAAAAVRIQREHAAESWPDGEEVRVRIGLHTGEPTAAEEGYVGLDVHRVARVMSAGHGGEILCSNATAGILAGDEAPDVTLLNLGTFELKDFARPEHLLRVVVDDLPSDFPAPSAPRAADPEATAKRRRRAITVFVVLVALVVVGAASFALAGGRDESAPVSTAPGTLVRIDPDGGARAVTSFPAGGLPAAVTVHDGVLFAALPQGRTVQRIDPASGRTTSATTTSRVRMLLGYGGSVWGYAPEDEELLKIDPTIPAVTDRTELETSDYVSPVGTAFGLAGGAGSLWVGSGSHLYGLDPGSVSITRDVVPDLGARPLAVEGERLWVAGLGGVAPYDTRTGAFGPAITVEGEPLAAAAGAGAVWVTSASGERSTLYRVDPAVGAVVTGIEVGNKPTAVVVGFGSVWVTSLTERLVLRVDPAVNEIAERIELEGSPTGLAVSDDGIWVSIA